MSFFFFLIHFLLSYNLKLTFFFFFFSHDHVFIFLHMIIMSNYVMRINCYNLTAKDIRMNYII